MTPAPHNKLRFPRVYAECNDVPGQKLPAALARDTANRGTPLNCAGIVKVTIPAQKNEGPPAGLREWVWAYLTQYQRREILKWRNRSFDMIWACGSGKTLASICTALYNGGPILFVTRAPARQQMLREFKRYTLLEPTVLEGETAVTLDPNQRVYIISWEILPHWKDKILEWYRQTYQRTVVWDEIHKAKNWRRQEKGIDPETGEVVYRELDNVSSSAAAIARVADYRIGLTATPIPNDLSDLWSQLDITEPNCWGTNWDFTHRYCDAQPGKYGGVDTSGRSNVPELNLRLNAVWSIVKKAEATADLPVLRRRLEFIKVEDQSRPEGFSKELERAAKQGRQQLFEMRLAESAARKRTWVLEAILEDVAAGLHVTVFTGRRKDAERLGEEIAKRLKGRPSWWAHGDSTESDRQRIIDAYRKFSGGCVFIGTGDAFGESVDGLQCTESVYFVMLPYTPRQIIQWEGRFLRRGSRLGVIVTYAIAEGTVDEHVADLLLNKLNAVEEVMQDEDVRGIAGTLSNSENEQEIIQQLLLRF